MVEIIIAIYGTPYASFKSRSPIKVSGRHPSRLIRLQRRENAHVFFSYLRGILVIARQYLKANVFSLTRDV